MDYAADYGNTLTADGEGDNAGWREVARLARSHLLLQMLCESVLDSGRRTNYAANNLLAAMMVG